MRHWNFFLFWRNFEAFLSTKCGTSELHLENFSPVVPVLVILGVFSLKRWAKNSIRPNGYNGILKILPWFGFSRTTVVMNISQNPILGEGILRGGAGPEISGGDGSHPPPKQRQNPGFCPPQMLGCGPNFGRKMPIILTLKTLCHKSWPFFRWKMKFYPILVDKCSK